MCVCYRTEGSLSPLPCCCGYDSKGGNVVVVLRSALWSFGLIGENKHQSNTAAAAASRQAFIVEVGHDSTSTRASALRRRRWKNGVSLKRREKSSFGGERWFLVVVRVLRMPQHRELHNNQYENNNSS